MHFAAAAAMRRIMHFAAERRREGSQTWNVWNESHQRSLRAGGAHRKADDCAPPARRSAVALDPGVSLLATFAAPLPRRLAAFCLPLQRLRNAPKVFL